MAMHKTWFMYTKMSARHQFQGLSKIQQHSRTLVPQNHMSNFFFFFGGGGRGGGEKVKAPVKKV